MSVLPGRTEDPNLSPSTAKMSPESLSAFQRLLYDQTGIVLKDNKKALLEARIMQRLRVLGLKQYGEYLDYLQRDASGQEMVQLIDVVSTNITRFFRDADHFDLIGNWMDQWTAQGQRKMRFWSAGCSSGEEPYSLALTVYDQAVAHNLDLMILATDISTRVLSQAQAGVYPDDGLQAIPEPLRNTHFRSQPVNGRPHHAVSDDLKSLIMFRRMNFTRMPYPINGQFDVILCRNAMIYFDNILRTKMIREFYRLLRPGGYFCIGHAETLIGMDDRFQKIKPSVYQKTLDGPR